MARVTVEDCERVVSERFLLVLIAAKRARDISAGVPPKVERDNDKNPVVALREIAGHHLDISEYEESLIKSHQRVLPVDEEDEEIADFMQEEQSWAASAEDFEDELDGVSQIGEDDDDMDDDLDADLDESDEE